MAITKKTTEDILKKQNLKGIDAALVPYKHLYEATDNIEARLDDLEDGDLAIDTITPTSGTLTVDGDLEVPSGNVQVSTLVAGTANITDLILDGATVTQATSITTGVILNKISGVITTVASTLAAQGSAVFTVTCSEAETTSRILVNVEYAGAGIPVVTISAVAAGSFDVKLYNAHGANAFNAALKIHFLVIA